MNICVFASSSEKLDAVYFEAAKALGARLARTGHTVVFGAGDDGLMGALARGAKEAGGYLIGVIPHMFDVQGVVFSKCDEVHKTKTMRERKALMAQKADAFIALPGGFGTLEELLEVITLKQLCVHNKPIAIIDTNGFYSHLVSQFGETVNQGFAADGALTAFGVYEDIDEAIAYIDRCDGSRTYAKHAWLDQEENA